VKEDRCHVAKDGDAILFGKFGLEVDGSDRTPGGWNNRVSCCRCPVVHGPFGSGLFKKAQTALRSRAIFSALYEREAASIARSVIEGQRVR